MVEKLRKTVESFYTDRCSVFEKTPVNKDGRTEFEEKVRYENVPCRVSAKSYLFGENAGSENEHTLKIKRKVKLFLPPECVIKPGSRVEVKGRDRTMIYGKSGEMSVYESHNEVMVETLKNYA